MKKKVLLRTNLKLELEGVHQICVPTHIDSNSKRGIARCKKNNELLTYTFDSAGNHSVSDIIFVKV